MYATMTAEVRDAFADVTVDDYPARRLLVVRMSAPNLSRGTELLNEVLDAGPLAPATNVVLDLSELEGEPWPWVRLAVALYRKLRPSGAMLALCGLDVQKRVVLRNRGLHLILPVFPDLREAVAAVNAHGPFGSR